MQAPHRVEALATSWAWWAASPWDRVPVSAPAASRGVRTAPIGPEYTQP
jgi:hypothetical protein